MIYKYICRMNYEIGVIHGIALGMEGTAVADNLFAAAEILEGIAEKLMQEVTGEREDRVDRC